MDQGRPTRFTGMAVGALAGVVTVAVGNFLNGKVETEIGYWGGVALMGALLGWGVAAIVRRRPRSPRPPL